MKLKELFSRPFTAGVILSRWAIAVAIIALAIDISTIIYTVSSGKVMEKTGTHVTVLMASTYVSALASAFWVSISVPLYWFRNMSTPKAFAKDEQMFLKFRNDFHQDFFRNMRALKLLEFPEEEEQRHAQKLVDKRKIDSLDFRQGMRIVKDSDRRSSELHVVFVAFCYPEYEKYFRLLLDFLVFTNRTKPWKDTYRLTVVPKDDTDFWGYSGKK